jgi:hypothetical protein
MIQAVQFSFQIQGNGVERGLLLLHLEHSIVVVIGMCASMRSGKTINVPIALHFSFLGQLLR